MKRRTVQAPAHGSDESSACVGVFTSLTSEIERNILRGIVRYANALTDWHMMFDCWPHAYTAHDWRKCDAFIVRGGTLPTVAAVEVARTVLITGKPLPCAFRVWTDDRRIGSIAAEYLLSKGHERFVFAGNGSIFTFAEREAGFRERILAAGKTFVSVSRRADALSGQLRKDETAKIGEVLRQSPKPVAVCTGSAIDGRSVLQICRAYGLAVPHEVSVVSCDDDALIAKTSNPTLSGVDIRAEAIGYAAALHLDALISDPASVSPNSFEGVAPGAVVARASSDATVQAEPCVAKALRFIRLHALERVSTDDIARNAGVAERTLDRAFRAEIGRSPYNELLRLRLVRAHDFVTQTDWSINRISERCGFCSRARFVEQFKREYGYSPTQHRRGKDTPIRR